MFEGHAPGDTVRCPVDGCAFRGTASQVVAHVVEADDADHAAAERGIGRERAASAEADRPAVEEFVRLFEAVHGGGANYESEAQGGWLFPFGDE